LQIKELSKGFVRKLKNPDFSLAEDQHSRFAKRKKTPRENENSKPGFEIDNTQNLFVVTGVATDTRVLVESFL